MLNGDSRCFRFCPFAPSLVNLVRNLLWPSPRFCEMQTARGTLRSGSQRLHIIPQKLFYWRPFLPHDFFFFFSCRSSFWCLNLLKLCDYSKGWLALGEIHLSLKPAAAEKKGRDTRTRQGADCQPLYEKDFYYRNRQTSDILAPSIECIVPYVEYLITEDSYGFQLTESSNQYWLCQTLIYLSYNSLNLKYYWFSSRWLRG